MSVPIQMGTNMAAVKQKHIPLSSTIETKCYYSSQAPSKLILLLEQKLLS